MGKKRTKTEKQRMVDEGGHEGMTEEHDVESIKFDDDTSDSDETTNGPDGSVEQAAEQVVQASIAQTRIEIDVAVNGIPAGQRLTVDPEHKFYKGLLDQKMAHVIEDED